MSTAPVQTDLTLWSSLRTRRRPTTSHKGLDASAARWRARLQHARISVGHLRAEANAAIQLRPSWCDLTESQLDDRIADLRSLFARRQHQRDDVRQALAAAREINRRVTGLEAYPVQLMGALGLFHGQILEMATGEGKTLTGSLGAILLGWLRRPLHVITVNDYLAQRDAEHLQPVYRRAGLAAASIVAETPEPARGPLYRMPIIYVTQKELVADWLRDQLRLGRISDPVSARWREPDALSRGVLRRSSKADQVLVPGLHAVIVDEADAVLIDEAVTPLIIAQPRTDDAQGPLYCRARDIARELKPREHFTVEFKKRRCRLTHAGREAIQDLLTDQEHAIWRAVRRREELVEQALTAEYCYEHGAQYQIVEDKIVIVDEYTGRFMEDRQWQHGLHQAVEAKHDLEVTADRDTLASLSFQRFFKLYPHLAGMTGTAANARPEIEATYERPVRVIPTHRPVIRETMPESVYVTEQLKWEAIVREIVAMHAAGRPVLVGTRSIASSEMLSERLAEHQLEHQVLNAVHHKEEAAIVAEAGQAGRITVATNMAGRGTDIKLGHGVKDKGGLHVILTERHGSKRVDRQLIGRAGRQGDPGSAHAIVSLEDELITKFTPKLGAGLRARYARRTEPLPRQVGRLFDLAQRRAERQAFVSRLNVLLHDIELDKALPR